VPGGPALSPDALDDLEIRAASVGPMDNNAYLLTSRSDGAQLLIDAADDPDRLLALVDEGTGRLDLVVTTHRHPDHHRALASLVAVSGARVAAGADDAEAITEATGVPIAQRLHDGDPITIGRVTLQVIALRGHTPGSVALAYAGADGPAHLFTGDSLFPGGVGATTSPEAFTQLYDDVVARLFDRFADDTVVHPGHGLGTTLGAERPHLAQWRARGW
jgi:glyoxylase-like metal-dependent hydrolase (beta-lactamase superfamily II)